MNEQLKIRLGEYLLSEGVKFDRVQGVSLDEDDRTLDVWYVTPDERHDWHPLKDDDELQEFLEFLVTGGK